MTIWETNLAKKIPLKSSSVWKHLICSISQSVFETILFLILIREKTHGKKFWCQNIYTNLQKKNDLHVYATEFHHWNSATALSHCSTVPLLLCPIIPLSRYFNVSFFPVSLSVHFCIFSKKLVRRHFRIAVSIFGYFSASFFFLCVFFFFKIISKSLETDFLVIKSRLMSLTLIESII